MKQIITSKLTRRCLILAFMIMGLIYVASSDRYAQMIVAAPCCEYCPGSGDPATLSDACAAQCGSTTNSCYTECIDTGDNCYARCVYCGSGGGDGSCNSSSDCPSGQYCGADEQCHSWF